jgi:hypothetical protein
MGEAGRGFILSLVWPTQSMDVFLTFLLKVNPKNILYLNGSVILETQ